MDLDYSWYATGCPVQGLLRGPSSVSTMWLSPRPTMLTTMHDGVGLNCSVLIKHNHSVDRVYKTSQRPRTHALSWVRMKHAW